ncbi:MAG TPA: hypothetical protein VM658_18265 [bacterium]|nr:hypothetical protein [bacterium]
MDRKKFGFSLLIMLSLALAPSWAARAQNPANTPQPKPAPRAQTGTAPAQPAAGPAVQNRGKALIALIESHPNGLIVNNNARVESPPSNQPYTADGSRNQNFKMVPDLSGNQIAQSVNMDQRRAQAVQELIAIGKPAVDDLAVALVTEGNQYRNLYAYALGEIKDPRAVPALIKYLEDGKAKLSMVGSVRASGNQPMAAKLEKQGASMAADSSLALQKITGQTYGTDLVKWQTWWNANKEKVGPTPNLILYTANPPAPAVHYDPNLLKPPPPQK